MSKEKASISKTVVWLAGGEVSARSRRTVTTLVWWRGVWKIGGYGSPGQNHISTTGWLASSGRSACTWSRQRIRDHWHRATCRYPANLVTTPPITHAAMPWMPLCAGAFRWHTRENSSTSLFGEEISVHRRSLSSSRLLPFSKHHGNRYQRSLLAFSNTTFFTTPRKRPKTFNRSLAQS
jgi:hypothetical protein